MILSEVFERFAEESPVTVMARAALENALPPSSVDALFEDAREAAGAEMLAHELVARIHRDVCNTRRRRVIGHLEA